MLKAAEAEAVLQQAKLEAAQQPEAPPAPWIKEDRKSKPQQPSPGPAPLKKSKESSRSSTTTAAEFAPSAEEAEATPKRKPAAVSMRR
jgi:hypothetical protein